MEYKIIQKIKKKDKDKPFSLDNLGYFLLISSLIVILIILTFGVFDLSIINKLFIFNDYQKALDVIKIVTYLFAFIKICSSLIITRICINLIKKCIWENIINNGKIIPLKLFTEFVIGNDFITLIKYYKYIDLYTFICFFTYIIITIVLFLGNPTFSNSFLVNNGTIVQGEKCYNKMYNLSHQWKEIGNSLKLIHKIPGYDNTDIWLLRYHDDKKNEILIDPNITIITNKYNETWNLNATYADIVTHDSLPADVFAPNAFVNGSIHEGRIGGISNPYNGFFQKRQINGNYMKNNEYNYAFTSDKRNNISVWNNASMIRISNDIDISNKIIFDIGSVYYKILLNQTTCIISIGKFENILKNGTNIALVNEILINIYNNISYDVFLRLLIHWLILLIYI